MTSVRVLCCRAAGGMPQLVRFELDGADHLVEEVIDEWPGADGRFLKLRADDGNLYVLHSDARESWSLTACMKAARALRS
jgi:hypothetical protein